MRLRRRVNAVAATVAGSAGCPGLGVMNRLATDEAADPPACPVCGGCHMRVIEEVVVGPGDAASPCHVRDRT